MRQCLTSESWDEAPAWALLASPVPLRASSSVPQELLDAQYARVKMDYKPKRYKARFFLNIHNSAHERFKGLLRLAEVCNVPNKKVRMLPCFGRAGMARRGGEVQGCLAASGVHAARLWVVQTSARRW